MTILVYRISGCISRSLHSATLVAEVEVDELPADLDRFARRYGGTFTEIRYDSPILEELALA